MSASARTVGNIGATSGVGLIGFIVGVYTALFENAQAPVPLGVIDTHLGHAAMGLERALPLDAHEVAVRFY